MRAAVVLALVALALPSVALASSSRRYSGTTAQGLSVSFTLASGKVERFRARVRCTSSRPQTFTFPTVRVSRRGRFAVHQAGPSLDGRLRGSRASGTLTLPGCDASANEVRFTARA